MVAVGVLMVAVSAFTVFLTSEPMPASCLIRIDIAHALMEG